MTATIARPWRCQCGRPLNPRGLSRHMEAHRTRGELNIEVRNTRDGRIWTYWPTR